MEVVVLPPQDALKRHHHHQQRRLISPNKPRRNPNPNPTAAVQTPRSSRRRRSSNSPPPPRPVSPTLTGPIRILKRGEGLPQPEAKPETKLAPVKPVVAGPIGPMFINGFYAGSACVTSPAPSELPVPAFFSRSCGLSAVADDKHQKMADDIRHMLRLF